MRIRQKIMSKIQNKSRRFIPSFVFKHDVNRPKNKHKIKSEKKNNKIVICAIIFIKLNEMLSVFCAAVIRKKKIIFFNFMFNKIVIKPTI